MISSLVDSVSMVFALLAESDLGLCIGALALISFASAAIWSLCCVDMGD